MASGLFFVDVDLFCFLADFLNYTYLCFKSLLSIFSAMILISTVLSNFLIFSFFQASRMFLMGEVSSNTPSVFILFSLFTLYYVYLSFILGKFHISVMPDFPFIFMSEAMIRSSEWECRWHFGQLRELFYWRYSNANTQFVFSPRIFFF